MFWNWSKETKHSAVPNGQWAKRQWLVWKIQIFKVGKFHIFFIVQKKSFIFFFHFTLQDHLKVYIKNWKWIIPWSQYNIHSRIHSISIVGSITKNIWENLELIQQYTNAWMRVILTLGNPHPKEIYSQS